MGFTNAQERSIKRYTDSHYHEINGELRGDNSGDSAVALDIYNLDSILESSKIGNSTMVFRGVGEAYVQELERRRLQIGDTIQDKAFLSTSRRPEEAKRFTRDGNSGMLLRIRLPMGCSALDLSPYSVNPSEEEILLARGTKLRVLGYDADEDILDLEVTTGD